MAPQLRISPCSPYMFIAPYASTNAKGHKVLGASSKTHIFISACSTFFLILAAIVGCTNLRYGQIDCAVLEGEAARMCQEYRQRKADADIRVAAVELVQGYTKCIAANTKPADVKKDCSIYSEPLKNLGLKPLEVK